MIGKECSIVYTDFANNVGPIVMALCDQGVQAIGYPDNPKDNRRWIGGLMRKYKFTLQPNFHSHNSISTHRIPTKIRVDAVRSNPALKTTELACGQGLGYCPAAADLSAAHKGPFVNKY